MWYYEIAHQPQGPVGAETIQQLLAAGTINAATLVWRAGMPNWKPLQQTELAEIWQKVLPDMSLTAVAYAKPNRPVKSSALKKLFVWWLVLESIGLVYVAINYFLPNASIKTTISCIIELPMIASVVLLFVLLFQFWKIVQDGFAPTTPAKAVGFLFIPIFNLYWNFPALFGLAKDLNRYSKQHFENLNMKRVITTHPILALVSIISSYLFTGYFFYFMIRIFSLAFAYRGSTAAYTAAIQSMAQPMTLSSLVALLIQILFIVDLYRAASSILTTEEAL